MGVVRWVEGGSYEGVMVRTLGWYENDHVGMMGFVHSNRESKPWVDLETKLGRKWSIAVSCVQMKKRVGIIGMEPRSRLHPANVLEGTVPSRTGELS